MKGTRHCHFHLGETVEARRLVKTYHYSHSWPAGAELVGTFHADGGLFGDSGPAIAACLFGQASTWREPVYELTRLVRDPDYDVPLSALVASTTRWLHRKRLTDLVVSYASIEHGHHGGIYQACSWHYHGQRPMSQDGFIIDGMYVPNRAATQSFGTKSLTGLQRQGRTVTRHIDQGKHLYWRPLTRAGTTKAERLGLTANPYPKPDLL